MIRTATGEVKIDDYKLVIHPELTLPQFKAGDIPILKASSTNTMGWTSCWFNGSIDGLESEFTVQFRFQKVQQLIWELANRRDLPGEQLKRRLDGWLLETIGQPPYEYSWGFISCGIDAHSGVPSIGVTFKNKIVDMGFKDVASFYEFQRTESKA